MCASQQNSLDTPSIAKWQHFLDTPKDGKPVGWHDYDSQPSARLEQAHTGSFLRCCVAHIQSGYYHYEVNLVAMTQRNMTTGRIRTIRRHEEETILEQQGKAEAADAIEPEDLEDDLLKPRHISKEDIIMVSISCSKANL